MSLVIKLVRHRESEANVRPELVREIGDHAVPLASRGKEQARNAGRVIGTEFLRGALVYGSPYRRTRETLDELLDGARLEPGLRGTLRR